MPYCETSKGKIHYEIAGSAKNGAAERPVVFLHCWAGSSRFWKHQLESLKENYLCLAIDYPGHGKSEASSDDRYGPEPFAEVAREVVKKVTGAEKATLVGHSLGGMVAMHYAVHFPDEVNTLILVSTSAHLRGQLGHHAGTAIIELFIPFFSAFTKSLGIYFTAHHPLTPLEIRESVRREVVNVPNDVVTKTLKGINRFNIRARLRDLPHPTLILNGSLDLYTDIRHALALQMNIPNAKLRIVPRSGHMGMLENPKFFNNALREFLDINYNHNRNGEHDENRFTGTFRPKA